MNSTHQRVFLAVVAGAVLAAFVVGCGRSAIATVNGRKITRQEYYNRLERLPYSDPISGRQMEAGAFILDQLIGEELVLRYADEKKVAPSEKDVNARMAFGQKQPGFAGFLRKSGITRDQFRERMRVEQAVFNLQTRGVKVTDKEIEDYYNKNKATQFTEPEQAIVSAILAKNSADSAKVQQLLDKGVDFATVARTLSADARLADPNTRLVIAKGDRNASPAVQNLVLGTPVNKCTKPIPYGNGAFLFFKVLKHIPEKTTKLRDAEFQIHQQLMVEKGVAKKKINLQAELLKYRDTARIGVNVDRYRELLVPAKPKEESKEAKTKD